MRGNALRRQPWLEVPGSGPNMSDAAAVALTGVQALGTGLSKQITQLLQRWQQGDMDAREHLFEALYSDLMLIARNRLSQQTNGTLQPAALVTSIKTQPTRLLRLVTVLPLFTELKEKFRICSIISFTQLRCILKETECCS